MTPGAIRIQRLVLHGVAPRDRAAVVEAFRAELARLVAGRAIAEPVAQPRPGAVLPAPANPGAAGRAAAGVVARAIGSAAR